MKQSIAIVLLCTAAAIGYGLVHDQITAHICVEYFTIGHPPMFNTADPMLLGLAWGIYATWWVGLVLGVLLAIAARAGPRPQVSAAALRLPILVLLAVTAVGATLAGVVGWTLASNGVVFLIGTLRHRVPPDRQVAFIADLWTHLASYGIGLIGGMTVVIRVWRSRSM